jgi:hypothetical protein
VGKGGGREEEEMRALAVYRAALLTRVLAHIDECMRP